MKIYAVVDRKAKNLVSIFTSVNNEAAERSFLMLLTGPSNIFTDFPEDFDLYRVCDLSLKGSTLHCDVPDCESLIEHGFKPGGFTCSEALKNGSDYDKRYLKMLHNDRFITEVEEDVDDDE